MPNLNPVAYLLYAFEAGSHAVLDPARDIAVFVGVALFSDLGSLSLSLGGSFDPLVQRKKCRGSGRSILSFQRTDMRPVRGGGRLKVEF